MPNSHRTALACTQSELSGPKSSLQPLCRSTVMPPHPLPRTEASNSAAGGIKVQLSGYCRAMVMIKPGTYLCCKWGAVERSSRADPTVTSGSLIIRVTATSWNGISSALPRFNVILRKITQTVKKSELNPSNQLQRICSVITKVSKEQS